MNSHKFFAAVLAHPMCHVFFKLMAFVLLPVVSWTSFAPSPAQQSHTQAADDDESTQPDPQPEGHELFPRIDNFQQHLNSSVQPCSTGLSTKLLPVKNEYNQIEWTFADDVHENHEHISQTGAAHPKLSPTVSNSSNNESIISYKFNDTPTSLDSQTPSPPGSPNSEAKTHQCPHCEATFKLRGYLTRHLKKHAVKKAYSCPFHKFAIYVDENNTTHKCHPTGGFSRRDTYKMHLKSRHFLYPEGTKSKQRGTSSGHCAMCGEYFASSEIWSELHIEGGECKFLPVGFKGKSRIKKRLEKQLRESLKNNRRLQNATSEQLKSAALLNKDLLHAEIQRMAKKPSDTNNSSSEESDHVTPQPPMPAKREMSDIMTFDDFKSHQFTAAEYEDYDDEFCLDMDQMAIFEAQERYLEQHQFNAPAMSVKQDTLSQPTPASTPNGYQSSPYQSSFQSSPYHQANGPSQEASVRQYNFSAPSQVAQLQMDSHFAPSQYNTHYQQFYETTNPTPVHVQAYGAY